MYDLRRGGMSELLNANDRSKQVRVDRSKYEHAQTNVPHLDFSNRQSGAAIFCIFGPCNFCIFGPCNRKISRNFKCTKCHLENCSTAVTQPYSNSAGHRWHPRTQVARMHARSTRGCTACVHAYGRTRHMALSGALAVGNSEKCERSRISKIRNLPA